MCPTGCLCTLSLSGLYPALWPSFHKDFRKCLWSISDYFSGRNSTHALLILQNISLHILLIDTSLNFMVWSLCCHSFDFKNVVLLMQMRNLPF